MREMIERVARALAASAGESSAWYGYTDPARAAISAMRESTETMRIAARDHHYSLPGESIDYDYWPLPGETWRVMTDAALV